jgi:signal transduction histidine kinase
VPTTYARYLVAAIVTTVVAGGATALLLTHLQNKELETEAKDRVELVSKFGNACRDYAKESLRPAVEHRLGEFEPIPPVVTDKHRVLQILVNLVSSAADVNPPLAEEQPDGADALAAAP